MKDNKTQDNKTENTDNTVNNDGNEKPRRADLHRKNHQHRRPWRLVTLIALLVAAVVAMVVAFRCSRVRTEVVEGKNDASLPAKSGGDTLDVAIEISPLSYSMAADSVSGLDYELMQQVAQIAGRPVKFHPFAPYSYAVRGLDQGVFDIAITALPATEVLKEHLPLTSPTYTDRQVIVQRRDDTAFVADAHRLAGKDVWIADASPVVIGLKNLSAEIGDTIRVHNNHTYTADNLAYLVDKGDIPRAVISERLAHRLAAAYPGLDVSVPVSFTLFETWAVTPKRPELLQQVNQWLDSLRNTPAYARTLSKYL